MYKNIFIVAFLMFFMVAGTSFGGCASKQSNSTAQDSSKQPEKAPKPAPEGQSLYNSSSFTEEKASGYYSHGFSEAQLQKLQEAEENSAEQ